jgi:O-antigen/teichoic acid export membrane protein
MNFSLLRTWSLRGIAAVVDQGLYSSSNFILNILLARWLAPVEYGAFAVAFAIFLFLSGFHNALLLEPMSVLGPGRYSDRIDAYLLVQMCLHFALTLPLALLLALVGIILRASYLGDPWLVQALIGSGIALPFILLLWTVRRMFYILKRPAIAMFSSVLYVLFIGAGLWVMHSHNMVSLFTAFLWMGIASLLSSITIMGIGSRWLVKYRHEALLPWNLILRDHWNFGKWILATAVLSVAVGQIQTFFLAGLLNLEAAGAFRAMQNFMLPIAQAVTAIAILGLPALAYDYGRGDLRSLRQKGLFITITLTGIAITYEILIWALAAPMERWFYGGKYASYAWLIPLLGLIPVFTAMATGLSLILRAIQKPQVYLITGIVSSVTGLFSALMLTSSLGVSGAALSLVLTYFSGLAITLYLYNRWFQRIEAHFLHTKQVNLEKL